MIDDWVGKVWVDKVKEILFVINLDVEIEVVFEYVMVKNVDLLV